MRASRGVQRGPGALGGAVEGLQGVQRGPGSRWTRSEISCFNVSGGPRTSRSPGSGPVSGNLRALKSAQDRRSPVSEGCRVGVEMTWLEGLWGNRQDVT